MIKAISLAAGLATGALCSQAPEFTQQYLQRLGGQVDALTSVVMDFDASALASGLGREQALSEMTGTDFLIARQADMRATFARHTRLSQNLTALRDATPLARLAMPHRLMDRETATAAWADFQPAVPLTAAGFAAGGAGFLAGGALIGGLLALLGAPIRRRDTRQTAQSPARREPVLRQPAQPQSLRPQLMGERR